MSGICLWVVHCCHQFCSICGQLAQGPESQVAIEPGCGSTSIMAGNVSYMYNSASKELHAVVERALSGFEDNRDDGIVSSRHGLQAAKKQKEQISSFQ